MKGLNLSYLEFVDLCIMLKCDYNENIKKIGIATAYKLISQYKSIDKLPSRYDKTCLNHEICRMIFLPENKTYESLCKNPDYKLQIKTEFKFNKIGFEKEIDSIKYIYDKFIPKPFLSFKLIYNRTHIYVEDIEYKDIKLIMPDLSKINLDDIFSTLP